MQRLHGHGADGRGIDAEINRVLIASFSTHHDHVSYHAGVDASACRIKLKFHATYSA